MVEATQKQKIYGKIEMSGRDIAVMPTQFDRIAVGGGGQLLLLSIFADTHRIKQIRACLNGGAKVHINCSGVSIKRPSEEDYYARSIGNIYSAAEGYNLETHKLGYGQAHAMLITRAPGFMIVVNATTLWQELNDNRFSTPILKEWMPHIESKLREGHLLEEARVLECECGTLSATTDDLDKIVQDGIKVGAIEIPRGGSA